MQRVEIPAGLIRLAGLPECQPELIVRGGQIRPGGSVGRAMARGTAADQTVRSALSTSRREGTAAHGLCALEADSGPTSLGQNSGACSHAL